MTTFLHNHRERYPTKGSKKTGVFMKQIVKNAFVAISFTLSSTVYALSGGNTLGDWRNASYTEKTSLAQAMSSKINKPGVTSSALVACINETAGDEGLDQVKISEVAAACAVLL